MSIVVSKTRLPVTEWQTASGSVVSIANARRRDAKSAVVTLQPIQDLHGYSAPWVGGAGKNKFNQSDSNGLTVDISVYAYNDTKALAQLNTLQAGAYTLTWQAKIVQISPTATDPTVGRYGLYFRATDNGVNFNVNGQINVANPTSGQIITKSVTFTLTADYVGKFQYFWIYCGRNVNGGGYDTCYFYDVQIEIGSTATAYEPYENLCPISGHTAVTVNHAGASQSDNPTSITVQLGQTVYGGTVDLCSGVGALTAGYLQKNTADMNNTENYPGWKSSGVLEMVGAGKNGRLYNVILNCGTAVNANTTSSQDTLYLPKSVYNMTQSEWKALALDCQFVIPLANPITFQLSPTQIAMLERYNTLWADEGDISVTYARIHS